MSKHEIPVKPIGTKIIVSQIPKKEEKLASGIVISASANAELLEGEVVEVSEDVASLFCIGDVVLYAARKGVGQIFDGKPYLWLNTNPVLEEVWGIKKQ